MVRLSCRLLTLLLVLGTGLSSPILQRKRYDNHRLIRVRPINNGQLQTLQRMQYMENLNLDYWKQPVLNHDVDIRVPPQVYNDVTTTLSRRKMAYRVVISNLQSSMDVEQASMKKPDYSIDPVKFKWMCDTQGINCETSGGSSGSRSSESIVGRYARHYEILTWMQNISTAYSNVASVQSIGQSYEGRDMLILKLGKHNEVGKPIIWIEAGIHAREWIAPAVAISTIDKMVREYGNDPDVTMMLDTYDWYILPSANPDGYEYSHTTDRLWRKTRSPQSRKCVGADPNRNFDVDFGGAGTSTNPCSDTYPGTRAFSEVETSNIRDAIWTIRDKIKVFLSFHAYSQLMLTPFGYTSSKPADNTEMMRVAQLGMDSLRSVHGKTFVVGTPPDLLYAASGGSYDWAKVVAGIKYAYTYELRPAEVSFGQSGFVLNENEIVPSSEEVWASLVTIAREVR